MTDRWAVERALLVSDLPSQARLIVFVLLTHVTQGTLVVPPRFAPSFTTLVKETGLSRGSVSTYLNQLEGGGWVERHRPSTKDALSSHARTGYQLQIPQSEPVQDVNQFSTRTSSGDERGTQEDLLNASTGREPVQDVNGTSSGAELKSNVGPTSSSLSEKKGGSGGNTAEPKKRKRAKKLAPVDDLNFIAFYEALPCKEDRLAASRAWAETVQQGVTPEDLLVAAQGYREDPERSHIRKYIKTPVRFLRDGRYERYLPNHKPEDDMEETERPGWRDHD